MTCCPPSLATDLYPRLFLESIPVTQNSTSPLIQIDHQLKSPDASSPLATSSIFSVRGRTFTFNFYPTGDL